jgi:hypothetical protein
MTAAVYIRRAAMKYVIEALLLILYIACLGSVSFRFEYHDGSSFSLHVWLIDPTDK